MRAHHEVLRLRNTPSRGEGDHLGHGGTSEEKGFIAEKDGDAILVLDIAMVNTRVREDLSGIPHIVMGHSRTLS